MAVSRQKTGCELPDKAWRWVYTAQRMITDYQEGQTENKVQHNSDFTGIPRTGKNHTKKVIEEWGMASDNIKTVFPHASKPGHLQEILQFMVPFGYFREEKAMEEINGVVDNLVNGEYEEHEINAQDLESVEELPLGGNTRFKSKIEKLNELIDQEENPAIKRRLRKALGKFEEINDYLSMWENNVLNEKRIPRVIRESYSYHNDQGEKKYSLSNSFDMRVLVPISTSMPHGVEYPDFFEPYAIRVDRLKEYDFDNCLNIIFGGRNYESYRELFDKVVDVGDTEITDLKAPDVQTGREHVDVVSFADTEYEILSSDKDPTQVMDRFKQTWATMFNKKGLICGSDFEWTLEEKLKGLLLEDDVDSIVLYTGFLQNSGIKKFVLLHFMEMYEQILDNLTPSEERNIRKKFVVDFVESQLVIQRRTDFNSLNNQDKQVNSFMSDFIEQSGHIGSDVWADAKPNTVNPLLTANTEHSFITKIGKDDWEDLFKGLESNFKKSLKNAFQDQDYTNADFDNITYGKGFVLLTEGSVTDWKKPTGLEFDPEYNGRPTYGYRHITPRMTAMKPIPFSHDDPSFFTEDMGYKDAGRVIMFDDYVDELMQKWNSSDQEIIEMKDRQLEKKRKEQEEEQREKKDLIKQNVVNRLENIVAKREGIPGEDYDWSEILMKIKDGEDGGDEVEFGKRTLEKWTKDTRDRLKEEALKEPEEKLDPKDVAEELKRDLRFVFGARSTDRKMNRAVDYIMDNYDTAESYARNIADRAVDKAMTDLEFEGIIDSSHNVHVDGESLDEQKENYKEIMGIQDEESSGSSPDGQDMEEGSSQEEDSNSDLEDDGGSINQDVEDQVADALDIPGEPWSCDCGRMNSGQHASCPRCDTRYDEVDE